MKKSIISVLEVDSLIFFGIVIIIAVGIAVWENYKPHYQHISTLPTIQKVLPLTVVPKHGVETVVWDSPDGNRELEMQVSYQKDGSKTYTFNNKDLTSKNKNLVFYITVDRATIMQIPFNSWSPDNGYIFVVRVKNGATEYLVAKSSGELFAPDTQFLNVSELFTREQTGYSLHEVTGWASPTLLIITTQKNNNEAGPSYWFDVSSQTFIQLATQF